jgi:hypothetical protein
MIFAFLFFLVSNLFLAKSIDLDSELSNSTTYISSFQCDYYLGESLIPNAGKGIFYFGSDALSKDQVIEDSPTLFIRYEQIYQCVLEDYIFESYHKDYGILLLGIGSLINHGGNQFSIQHYDSSDNTAESRPPTIYMSSLSASTFYYLENVEEVNEGEELLIDYGEGWFENRSTFLENVDLSIEYHPPLKPGVFKKDLKGKICLSTTEHKETTKYQGGNGVFTKKSFQKGELITVSPLLILPYHIVEESKNSSLLMNYCYYNEEEAPSIAFLPLALPSLINHYKTMYLSDESLIYPIVDNDFPNVEMRWLNWTFFLQCSAEREKTNEDCFLDDRLHNIDTSMFEQDGKEELFEGSEPTGERGFSVMNTPSWKVYSDLVIAYYATRNLKENDELFLDYGERWENEYYKYLIHENTYDMQDRTISISPSSDSFLFRHPVLLPSSLFH